MNSDLVPVLFGLTATAFLGSWHCGAMCGPIASTFGLERKIHFYHLGRLISYLSVGALGGFAGQTFSSMHDWRLRVCGFLILGALLILGLFAKSSLPSPLKICPKPPASGFPRASQFLFGLSSILLPCGWLWAFVAAASATGSPTGGLLVMFVLWLSSIPALSLASLLFRTQLKRLSPNRRSLARYVLLCAGLFSLVQLFFVHQHDNHLEHALKNPKLIAICK